MVKSMKRVERVLNARILLVTDDSINFNKVGRRYAYYRRSSFFGIFEKALKQDLMVNMVIERLLRDRKLCDTVIEVKIVE